MSSTVSSFTISQRAADEREAELRDARRGLEERMQSLEIEKVSQTFLPLFCSPRATVDIKNSSLSLSRIFLAKKPGIGSVPMACNCLANGFELRGRTPCSVLIDPTESESDG